MSLIGEIRLLCGMSFYVLVGSVPILGPVLIFAWLLIVSAATQDFSWKTIPAFAIAFACEVFVGHYFVLLVKDARERYGWPD